jgi:hypothetical protein
MLWPAGSGACSADITPLRRLGNRAPGMVVSAMYRTRYSGLC